MAQIVFEKVRYKNFLSTGNIFLEVPLNQYKTMLIVGKNGRGKSIVTEGIVFALFDKSFRGLNKPALVNSINGKDCVVELEFSIGISKYKIVRGIKPAIFEIWENGSLIGQDAATKDYQKYLEEVILRFNYKAFTQIVILGSSSYIPFMKLNAAARRDIIEDLLDIRVFSAMNVVAKDKASQIKNAISETIASIETTLEKLQLQKKYIEDKKKDVSSQVESKQKECSDIEANINEHVTEIGVIQKHVDILTNSISDCDTKKTQLSELNKIHTKLITNKSKIIKEIEFYTDNTICPTCTQDIHEEFKRGIVWKKTEKSQELSSGLTELETRLSSLTVRLSEISKVQDNISKHNEEISRINATIAQMRKYQKKTLGEIEALQNKNVIEGDLESTAKELYTSYQTAKQTKTELTIEQEYANAALALLKDSGIKAKIVQQYLPIINKLVNKYLTTMGLFVSFNLDEEFKETIKSRHRDNFSYNNFSEGQRMRIDLALLFTFRAVAKIKNSVHTNLLIMDEIFDSSFDQEGKEILITMIDELSKDTNIMVISHTTDQWADKFHAVMKVDMEKNFTTMVIE